MKRRFPFLKKISAWFWRTINKALDFFLEISPATCSCLTICAVFVINLFLGKWSVVTILSVFHIVPPTIAAFIAGIILGEFTFPIAVVIWFLRACGVNI